MRNYKVTYVKKDKPNRRLTIIVTQSSEFEARKWVKKKFHGQGFNIVSIKEV